MSATLWGHRPPPPVSSGASGTWAWDLRVVADVTAARGQLREAVVGSAGPTGLSDDDLQRLLLSFEELASNGVRHGRGPVRVSVVSTGSGWLVDVTDAAVDRPPTPAVDRDAAEGGLGLYLVARLSAAHGWTVRGRRKHVWTVVDRGGSRQRSGVRSGAWAGSSSSTEDPAA
jgi:anti-sigma regulatory factor (Ser/Thr protein kinase)